MTLTSVRKYIDCREFPSENNCSLKMEGTEREVLDAAAAHAVAAHAHADTPALREQLRAGMREAS
jgi:hypothetical protein